MEVGYPKVGRWEARVRSQVSGSESKISFFPNGYLTGTTISLPSAFEIYTEDLLHIKYALIEQLLD